MNRRRGILTGTGVFLVALFVAVAIGVFSWVTDVAEPMPEALAALKSDENVMVVTEPWLIFEPMEQEARSGLIFYPGGKVDPRAYAPAARAIAEAGHLVVIVPMPLNLAVLAPDRAGEVIPAFPDIDSWAIGGHSLGGSMAATFAYNRPELIDGLVLWASYPTGRSPLTERDDLQVGSIHGTLDGLVTEADIAESRSLLPSSAVWSPIEGGNHAQFGWYGPQDGDNPATITREQQQAATVSATVALLGLTP